MKRSLVILVSAFLVQSVFGQKINGIAPDKNDSSIQKGNILYRLLERADSARLNDSIQKVILEKQIMALPMYDMRRKRDMEARLQSLKTGDSLFRVKIVAETDSLRRTAKGYPVVLFRDTLFLVYSRVGSVSASARAALISTHLKQVARDYTINPDSILIVSESGYKDICYRDEILLSVTAIDAIWNNTSLDMLARQYREAIVSEMKSYRESVNLRTILVDIGLSLVVLVVLFFLIRLVRFLFRRIDTNLIPRFRLPEKWLLFKNYDAIHKDRQTRILLIISRFIRFALYFLLTVITILLVFNILPQTKPIGVTLLRYILDPLRKTGTALLDYIPNLITIIIFIILFRLLIRLIRYLTGEIAIGDLRIPGFYPEWAKPTFLIIRFVLIILLIVVIFPFLPGSNSVVFQGISVFIGLVISISSSSIIGNLIAGLVITYMRSFRIGDTIRTGENTGIVIEKTAFVTRIRTFKGEFITIPHSNILTSHVTNYSTSAEDSKLVLYTSITIGYDAPWQKVHELMISAALATQYILKDPPPFVLQTSLNDYHISYQLNAFTKNPEIQPAIYSELHQNIQVKFNEAGVEILSPMFNTLRKQDS